MQFSITYQHDYLHRKDNSLQQHDFYEKHYCVQNIDKKSKEKIPESILPTHAYFTFPYIIRKLYMILNCL